MELITVQEMDDLPDDPFAAFVQLERTCRNRMNEALLNADRNDDAWPVRVEYMTVVSAAAQQYGIISLDDESVLDGYSSDIFDSFHRRAMFTSTQLTLTLRARRAADSVALPDGAKARLRKHLSELEAALLSADLPEKKRSRLKSKLGDFATELEKERSNLTRILVGLAAVAAVLPQAEDGLLKLPGTVNAVLVLLGREKLAEEEISPPQVTLPASATRKSLPAPAKKPAFTCGDFADDLDDDVPF